MQDAAVAAAAAAAVAASIKTVVQSFPENQHNTTPFCGLAVARLWTGRFAQKSSLRCTIGMRYYGHPNGAVGLG